MRVLVSWSTSWLELDSASRLLGRLSTLLPRPAPPTASRARTTNQAMG